MRSQQRRRAQNRRGRASEFFRSVDRESEIAALRLTRTASAFNTDTTGTRDEGWVEPTAPRRGAPRIGRRFSAGTQKQKRDPPSRRAGVKRRTDDSAAPRRRPLV